jgi:immunity protein, SdpI family
MKNKSLYQLNLISVIILLIPFILIFLFWNDLPDQIPMHWNIQGEVDSYGSKLFGIMALPIFNIILFIGLLFVPKIDPRKENFEFFTSTFRIIVLGVNVLMLILFLLILATSLGYELNIGMIVIYITLLLFLILGNLMSKLRSNYFLGIRTPWTLDNEEVWRRTHRLAGHIWVWATIPMFLIAAVTPLNILVFIYGAYIALIALVPIIYSFIIHKQMKNEFQNHE